MSEKQLRADLDMEIRRYYQQKEALEKEYEALCQKIAALPEGHYVTEATYYPATQIYNRKVVTLLATKYNVNIPYYNNPQIDYDKLVGQLLATEIEEEDAQALYKEKSAYLKRGSKNHENNS